MLDIFRLKNDTCSDCIILHKTLNKERIERDKMKKEEKTKLLKTIGMYNPDKNVIILSFNFNTFRVYVYNIFL